MTIAGGAAAAERPAPQRLLVVGGLIRTETGWSRAMVVDGGVIGYLGDERTARRRAGPRAAVLDLKGATVLPGLVDSHVHPLFAGLTEMNCRLPVNGTSPQIREAIRQCVAKAPKGEWIRGGNWVAASFAAGEQGRAFLDAIVPDNPVALDDEALHSLWVNSRALQLAGIDRNTPNPPGGIIERDAAGEPTGLLRESATRLITKVVPPDSLERRKAAIKWAADHMLSQGITAFTVASIRDPDIEPFAQLTREGLVKQRIRGCIVWETQDGDQKATGERLIAARAQYETDRFKPDCVKIFMDGVPTESHTGAMLAPYADHTDDDRRPPKGLLLPNLAELNPAVARFDRMGLSVKFHAAGDAAVRAAIDAIAFARNANGQTGPMHVVAHSTFVDPADTDRLGPLNGVWEFSPYIWYPTPIASVDILKAVGPERMHRWIPIADILRTGALAVAGSDWPVVPSVDPWLALETLVTRQRPGGSPEALGAGQAIDRENALRLLTINGARAMRLDRAVGTLSVGRKADFIVTRENPLSSPVHDVHKTRVWLTFINGENVFRHPESAAVISSGDRAR
ncbi:hypothetical protein CHU93_07510 [Sandarakinorhabdus cyanobacteriorum]|uniref:Amidohydrolase 3 domain-containing protein n=2 Tax=Sandarakinorhabdus cyanobacteriorum TaxID=1981098 RepID=A0A255YJZ6_9SPHN|nr:hypothetical protein CHU93_07510 [Sandarakinorhabdus cyanobacteriorum]